jgi:hypothetical protein
MTKIKNTVAYVVKKPLALTDYAIGTNSENLGVGMAKGQSISMELIEIRNAVIAGLSPEIGGTLKIAEIEYTGVLTSPADVANALDPNYIVSPYEVLIFNVNGKKYILKLQDVVIGDGQPNISDSDFITIIAIQSTGLDVTIDGQNTVIESKAGVNVGVDGVNIYKGLNATSKLHEFRKAKSVGFDVTIETDGVNFEKKAGVNLGNGIQIYKGLNATSKVDEFYNLKSTTLNITKEVVSLVETGNVLIEVPDTASIPGLYVNNLYKPTYDDWVNGGGNLISNPSFLYKGEGTLSKPFTDSRNYTTTTAFTDTANTAIQNALDAYVGSGTRLAPEKIGQIVIIQNNQGTHIFPNPSSGKGDLNYTGLNLVAQGNVLSQKSGLILDLDDATAFDQDNSTVTIKVEEGVIFQIQGDGFNNSGNDAGGTTYATAKSIQLLGTGTIYSATNNISKYIINSGVTTPANNNDGNTTFNIYCNLRAEYQGVYKVVGNSRIDIYGKLLSGGTGTTINTNLKAFYQTGGQVRKFSGSETSFFNLYSDPNRDSGIVFEPLDGYIPIYVSQNSSYTGSADNLFKKIGTPTVTLEVTNSISGYQLTITNVFESANLWNVRFTENVLSTGVIDTTKADLTTGNLVSAVNTIGGNFIESLIMFTSKQNAKTYPLPINAAYLLKRDVNAGSLIIGTEYKIKTAGTGTPLGTVGNYFVAADNGSAAIGGVATIIERCVMV